MKFHIAGEKYNIEPTISFDDKKSLLVLVTELTEEITIMENLASLLETNVIDVCGTKNVKLDSVKKAAFLRTCCQENLDTIKFITAGCDT